MFHAHAREPCIRAGNKGNVSVCLSPFDIKPLAHGTMNFRLGCPGVQHPGDEAAPLVNLRLCAFDVGPLLAAPDYWWFGWFRVCHKSALACDRRDRRDTRPASVTIVTSVTG